jgi:general secretion pathway protein K
MAVQLHCPGGFLRRPQRGSVILFVLGVIFLTAFLLTRLIDRAGGELLAETKAASRTLERDQAYSALEVTLAVMADAAANDGGLHAPQQGWGDPLRYADYEPPTGFEVTVTFEDETGKLPLATATEAMLQNYLEAVGATSAEAERLTDALLAWTRADYLPNTSEADPRTYENSPFPYAPPHRAIRTFEELRAVAVARDLFFDADGRWTELGEKFRADASLQPFSQVNINSARPAVLAALGLEPTRANSLAEELTPAAGHARNPKFYRTINEAAAEHGGDLLQPGLGADVQCMRIRVSVKEGARIFQLEAVVQPGNNSRQNQPASAAPVVPADASSRPETPVDPRSITSKRVDYPFRILELLEQDGSV